LSLNDGSCLENLQVVILSELVKKKLEINFNSSLIVCGKLVLTPERIQAYELQVRKIELINKALETKTYPLQKKKTRLETIRNSPHLRAKTNYFLIIFRLRHNISKAIHDFFYKEAFYYVSTPIITNSDTEGAGKMFNIQTNEQGLFFSKPARLTVSGQLQLETLTQGLGKVYAFSPCFRAENSHTGRHLAEFWMIEAEMAFTDTKKIINLVEKLIKYIVKRVLNNNSLELKYLENYDEENKKEIINKLKKITDKKFKKINYNKAIEILKDKKKFFTFDDIKQGMDLQSEHEKYLCQYFNGPIFVMNYPTSLKAFYMKDNIDRKTTFSFDLLFPEIGELVGGGMREDNLQNLQNKARKINLNINDLK
jgi:asparaginyl-tRNA synthetase